MNLRHGILIRSDAHVVAAVHSQIWTASEIRRILATAEEIAIVELGRKHYRMAISEFLHSATAGKPSRSVGFRLFGETYYGDALIFGGNAVDDGTGIDSQLIGREIHFLRLEHSHPTAEYAPFKTAA